MWLCCTAYCQTAYHCYFTSDQHIWQFYVMTQSATFLFLLIGFVSVSNSRILKQVLTWHARSPSVYAYDSAHCSSCWCKLISCCLCVTSSAFWLLLSMQTLWQISLLQHLHTKTKAQSNSAFNRQKVCLSSIYKAKNEDNDDDEHEWMNECCIQTGNDCCGGKWHSCSMWKFASQSSNDILTAHIYTQHLKTQMVFLTLNHRQCQGHCANNSYHVTDPNIDSKHHTSRMKRMECR